MSTLVESERTDDAFADLWLQVGYHMVGALGHRFDGQFTTLDQRLGQVERGQAVLTERVDGLTVRMDRVEQRMNRVEQRLDKVEHRLENLESGQAELRDRLDRLEYATLRGFERIEVKLDALRGMILRSEEQAPPPRPVPRPRAKGR